MLGIVAEKLGSLDLLSAVNQSFNPSVFNDDLALKTVWTPLKKGGSTFRTHTLKEKSSFRLEYSGSLGSLLFSMVFIVLGLGCAAGFSLVSLKTGRFGLRLDVIMPLLIGVVFFSVGFVLLCFLFKPTVFDKGYGYYWKGWKVPNASYETHKSPDAASFEDIYALQLVSEYINSDNTSYYSYELNLVLKDGSRLNVVDHGNLESIRSDAAVLSSFLGKPVWDSIPFINHVQTGFSGQYMRSH